MATLSQIDRCTTAAGSIRNFGSPAALDDLGSQTIIVCCKPTGQGGGGFAYLYGKTPSASVNGPRVFITHNSGNPRLAFGAHSSGSASNPIRQSEDNFGTTSSYASGWVYYSITWDGSINATGIKLYKRPQADSTSTESASYPLSTSGSGSVSSDAANDAVVWNRLGAGREFAGDGAWVAVFDGVFTQAEIDAAIDNGPLSDNRLVALFANGDEIANSGISQASSNGITVVTDTGQFPTNQDLGSSGVSVTPAVATVTVSALAPTVSAGGVSVSPAIATITASALAPSVSVGVSVNPGVATVSVSALAPVVVVGGMSIDGSYERASVIVSGSSVSGSGDSAVISIKPKLQESESISSVSKWLKPHAKITGVNGYRPTFRFLDYFNGTNGMHGYPWVSTRRPMYSYDGEAWSYFDTTANLDSASGNYVEFRHNTAFTQNEVYVCWNRAVFPRTFAGWLDAWETSHPTKIHASPASSAYTPTANVSTWPAQWAIADEYSTQVDSLGLTVPVTPLYSFEIRDDSVSSPLGAKALIIIQLMTHAGEDQSLYYVKAMIDYLLAGAGDAPALLQYFDFEFHTCNMPGWVAGGWRGSWTQGVGGADDPNKHAWEVGTGLEVVDKPVDVMDAVKAGRHVAGFLDMHGAYTDPLFIYHWAGSDDEDFVAAYNSFGGPTLVGNIFSEISQSFGAQARTHLSTNDAFTFETGDPTPQSDSTITSAGQILARTWNKLRVDGNLSMPTGVNVTPSVATVTVSAPAPTVSIGVSVNPGIAAVGVQSLAPVIEIGVAVQPAIATVSVQALAPSVQVGGVAVYPAIVSVSVSAPAPIVEAGVSVSPPIAVIGVQALAPTIGVPSPVNVTPSICVVSVQALAPTIYLGGQWAAVNDAAETWQSVIEAPETWLDAV